MQRAFVILSTYQSPHFEDLLNFGEIDKRFSESVILNIVPCLAFRVDATIRRNTSIKTSIARVIRNNIVKPLWLKFWHHQNKIIAFKNNDFYFSNNNKTVSRIDFLNIFQSFHANECRSTHFDIDSSLIPKIDTLRCQLETLVPYIIKQFKITKNDTIVLFNGRLPAEALFKNLVLQYIPNLPIRYLETNQFVNKVILRDKPIHDLASYNYEIEKYVQTEETNDVMRKAFEIIRRNKESQPKGNAEKRFQKNRPLITFFASSLDEYIFYYDEVINQIQMIYDLIEVCKMIDCDLRVRVHPNIATKCWRSRGLWDYLKEKWPDIIINYDEALSSYFLIERSRLTISVGSSIAPQAVLMGHPHILVGEQNYYFNLSGFIKFQPSSFKKRLFGLLSDHSHLRETLDKTKVEADLKKIAGSLVFERELGIIRPYPLLGKDFNAFKPNGITYRPSFAAGTSISPSTKARGQSLEKFILQVNSFQELLFSKTNDPLTKPFLIIEIYHDGLRQRCDLLNKIDFGSSAFDIGTLDGVLNNTFVIKRDVVKMIKDNGKLPEINMSSFSGIVAFDKIKKSEKLSIEELIFKLSLTYMLLYPLLPSKMFVSDFLTSKMALTRLRIVPLAFEF